nr:CocE/NonD family hydrolase [Sphingomonas sp. Y57]
MDDTDFIARSASVRMHWGVRIPMRDGITLNATLYLPPEQARPAPAIFTLTPYVGQTYHDQALYFALAGYPFLTVDVRGRGNSEGDFDPFINEGRDGHDAVQWLAAQDYCDGRVAMWGGSYGGYDQWATARERPRALASIAPVASPFMGIDYPMRNNGAMPYWMQWLTLISGRTSQDRMFWNNERYWGAKFCQWVESGLPFRELDTFLGNPSPTFRKWVAHPEPDGFWDDYNLKAADYANIDMPVLTITGALDADQLGAMAHYREHLTHGPDGAASRHYLVIGPWDHAGTRVPQLRFAGIDAGPNSLVDLKALHRQWYDWTLGSGERPSFLKKNVAYYVMGADEWRYADRLEGITSHSLLLALQSDGTANSLYRSGRLVGGAQPSGEPDAYIYDPRRRELARLEATVDPEDRSDDRMVHASDGRLLIYHSDPLEADIEISGFFRFEAWFAIDQPDTDFHASVYEVDLRGRAIRLGADWVRARYSRDLRHAELVEDKEPRHYIFDRFMFLSTIVRKGHRLRLVVGPHSSIYHQRNLNSPLPVSDQSIDDARVVTVNLFHDADRPSFLSVPIGVTAAAGC